MAYEVSHNSLNYLKVKFDRKKKLISISRLNSEVLTRFRRLDTEEREINKNLEFDVRTDFMT